MEVVQPPLLPHGDILYDIMLYYSMLYYYIVLLLHYEYFFKYVMLCYARGAGAPSADLQRQGQGAPGGAQRGRHGRGREPRPHRQEQHTIYIYIYIYMYTNIHSIIFDYIIIYYIIFMAGGENPDPIARNNTLVDVDTVRRGINTIC